MEAVFLHLLNMSITATWIALAVIVLRKLLKKTPKWIMGILWGFVALRLICPFSIESVFSLIPSAQTVPPSVMQSSRPVINSGFRFIDSGINEYLGDHYYEGVTVPVNTGEAVLKMAAVVWLVGVLAMLLYAAISFLRIRKKVSESVELKNGVRYCDRISTPFILGIIKPKVYLPSSIDEEDAQYVLSHERAHLKRKDNLWKPLGFLLLTVYWFNPVLWLAYALLCRDIELACDERVIKEKGIEIKKPYSEALIHCSTPRRMIAACPLAFGEVGMKERVKSVLNYKKPAFWILIVAVIACAVAAVCLLTNPVNTTSLYGEYMISESIYCDGRFSYYMLPETAPTIEIDESMRVCERQKEELISDSVFQKTKLSQESFGGLFGDTVLWQGDESLENIQKQNKTAIYTAWEATKNGVFPYMILQQKDGRVYIVYANVQDGKPSCIRWIYTLEPQEAADVEISTSLAPFLDSTIARHHEASCITEDPFICIDYKILGTSNSGSETTVYMWVLFQEYTFDGELRKGSGAHIPTAVTVSEKTEADGFGYELVEYWEPRDGSFYATDIKDKFPQNLQRKALDSQWCVDEQEANCLKSAQQYYEIEATPAEDASVSEGTDAGAEEKEFKPAFNATVLEVYDGSVLVEPFAGTDERKSSDKISIRLDAVSTTPLPSLNKGDGIRIVYDGMIAETYPAQIDTVFAVYALDENEKVIYVESTPTENG